MPKKEMSSGYLLTLYYLCDLANKDTNIAYPSVGTIAREIGLSPKQVRRHTHKLIDDGFIKIVQNRLGGTKGQSCRYKISLPAILEKNLPVDNYSRAPMTDPNASHVRQQTTPANGSQTVVEPYITNKDINEKFGYGWYKNPDTAYIVGLSLGIKANPGEDTSSFVSRIYNELKRIGNKSHA
jgi:DNA-binding Lrp family transcriptional regulator